MKQKGLNLHHVVRSGIRAVLPDADAVLLLPMPWTVPENGDGDYRPHPEWQTPQGIMVHSQPVPDKLSFSGQERDNSIRRDFYLYGLAMGVSRADQLGGALLYWDGGEWLVEQVLEDWSQQGDWCKCRAVLQCRVKAPDVPKSPAPPPLRTAESVKNEVEL